MNLTSRRTILSNIASALVMATRLRDPAGRAQNPQVEPKRGNAFLEKRQREPRTELEWLINAELERLSRIRLVSIESSFDGREDTAPALKFSNAKAKAFASVYCDEAKKNDCPTGVYASDCSHFVSHVLAAGGVKLEGPSHTCSKGLATVVAELHAAFINASEVYSNVHVRKSEQSAPGDVMFLLDNLGAPNNHVMVLNGPIQNNGAKVFGHTNQRCDERATFTPARCVFYLIDDHS